MAVSEHERAEQLLRAPARKRDLGLVFDETVASSAEIHVEGRNFYPPMLADIASATSSIHINQFGFRPGSIGDEFAEVLMTKASDGVSVRVVVDRQGSDPDRGSRAFYERLLAAGVDIRVVRAVQLRAPVRPVVAGGPTRWNFDRLGNIDHRKLVVVDGRVGWVGGAGIEDHFHDGRFHDLFMRVAGPVTSQLQLVFVATFRWLDGLKRFFEIDVLVRSPELASQFDERFSAPAEVVSRPGRALVGRRERVRARAFATISPLL